MGKSKDTTHKGLQRYFPMYPFKSKLDRVDDFLYFSPDHTEAEILQKAGGGLQIPLTQKQLEIIDQTVKTRNITNIKCFIIQKCNVQNVVDLSWDDILGHLKFWLTSRQEQLSKKTGGKAGGRKTEDVLTGEAKALAILVEHPEWTDKKIAEAIGVSRTTLYDWSKFKKAKEALNQGKNRFPHGSKDGETGDIEAWEE